MDQKPCDPEACSEYQKEECRFSGKIYFMIPGIKGMGSWVLPTKSWYSMKRLKKTLCDMHRVTNGRIAYLLHKGEPIFVLRKVKATIPTIDWEKGETKMRQQYLIDLDVVVDPLEVAREYSIERILEKGAKAGTMLTTGPGGPDRGSQTENKVVEPASRPSEEEPVEKEATIVEKQSGSKQPETGDPKNGNGTKPMESDQKLAIIKMASKYQIQADTLDTIFAGVHSYDEAAKVIGELNRGDISRFLPTKM